MKLAKNGNKENYLRGNLKRKCKKDDRNDKNGQRKLTGMYYKCGC